VPSERANFSCGSELSSPQSTSDGDVAVPVGTHRSEFLVAAGAVILEHFYEECSKKRG